MEVQPDWGSQSRFALHTRPPPALWAADGVDGVPSLQSLCLAWLNGRLEDIESLEGLPQPFTELACFAASQRAPWKDDQRSLWTDGLLPALVGDGVAVLDLSGSPKITDAAMRCLAEHTGMQNSLQCISVASTSVTLQGVGVLVNRCTNMEYIDVSSCAGVVPERIAEVLPTRTPPEGWEDEADEKWRDSYPALSTIVCRNAPGPVIDALKGLAPWITFNPPDWEKSPLDACALRAEVLCPACLWVRPQPSQVLARRAAEAAQERAQQERSQGKWGPGELTPAQKLLAAIEHAESVGGSQNYGEEPEREGAVYLRRYDAGQPGLARQINRLRHRRSLLFGTG